MRYKNIGGRFFGLVIKHACDRQTERRTDRITTPKTELAQLRHAVKMETRHPVEGSFGKEFPSICNHCVVFIYLFKHFVAHSKAELHTHKYTIQKIYYR